MINPEDPFYGEEAQGGLLRAVRGRAAGKRAAAAAARAASGALPAGRVRGRGHWQLRRQRTLPAGLNWMRLIRSERLR